MSTSLLPQCPSEFCCEQYWNSFFAKRKQLPFEWYGEYEDLKDLFEKYLKPADKILHIGCGNSTLTETLFDIGFRHIQNVDISSTVVKQMNKRNEKRIPGLGFTVI
jgi:2-polyprenyl-3-methyl-5-hydroxy-6-metoxy-1,4-benzoquinol methylase